MNCNFSHFRNLTKYQYLRFITTSLLFVVATTLSGQRVIEGTVTDAETGEPLIGANVVVKDTTYGTVTDIDGNYVLNVPEGHDVLMISYTGYRPFEVTLTSANRLDIPLVAGELLEEVVVIGYGTVKREDATGSIQTVSSESFNKGAITGAQELLAGKVPGVVISTGGGLAMIRPSAYAVSRP